MPLDERTRLGFEFAKEIATQLITLSTGLLALTITFMKELSAFLQAGSRTWLYWAWGLQLSSIICGVWTLMALTGALMPSASNGELPPTFGGHVRLPALFQVVLFLFGVASMVAYGSKALRRTGSGTEKPRR
jgi:hypothetical protein